jgi:hypothetical protein
MANNSFNNSDKELPTNPIVEQFHITFGEFDFRDFNLVDVFQRNSHPHNTSNQNVILNPAHNSHQSELTQAFKKMLKMYITSLNISKDVIREFLNDYLKEDTKEEDNEEAVNKIVLLVFEDNTIQPVIKVNDDLMNIIKGWYEKCDLLLTIEETELAIPKNILNKDKLDEILNSYVNYKDKEKYIREYIPNEIIKTITKEIAEKLEKEIQVKKITICKDDTKPKQVGEATYSCSIRNVIYNNNKNLKINDMRIVIPEYFMISNENQSANSISPVFETNIAMSSNVIKPYNEDGNCLYKSAFDNCEKWDNYDIENKKETEKKQEKIYILLNHKFLKTITVINPDENMDYIINDCKGFGFISILEYETAYPELVSLFNKNFDNIQFYSIDEVNKKLDQLALNCQSLNETEKLNNKMQIEEKLLKKYIFSMYTTTEDESDIVLCSSIYHSIIDKKIINIVNNNLEETKKRISLYLKNLGFCKKWVNNQAYYCKIVEKQLFVHQKIGTEMNIHNPKEMRIFMNNLYKLRQDEMREIAENYMRK